MEDVLFVIVVGANDAFFDTNASGVQTAGNILRIMKELGKNGGCCVSWI
jgi:hypothetical protein